MSKRIWAVLLFAAIPGFADVKITTTYTTDGQTAQASIYGNGTRLRYEYGKSAVVLRQCDQKRIVQVDDQNKSFVSLPAEESAAAQSGNAEVTDTGERKEMFGYPARHLKVVEKSDDKKERTETDGWYAEFPALGACTGQAGEAAKRGYPMEYTTTAYGENGKVASAVTMRVTAVEAAPLAASLFEIPVGYIDSSAQKTAAPRVPGTVRVGAVAMRTKSKGQGSAAYEHLMAQLLEAKIDVQRLPDGSPEVVEQKARQMQCDYLLYTEVASVEKAQTGKLGGMLHHTPGLGHVTGGDPFEARVDYRLVPGTGGSPLAIGSVTGKSATTFNWKSAAMLASSVVPMAMAAKMFSGALNPAMMNALMSGRGYGASMVRMDPMMGGISAFLGASNPGGAAASAGHSNADTAIAAALEQEGKAIIAQVKGTSK